MKRFSLFAICMLASMLMKIRGDDEMPGYNSDYNASVRELLRSIITNPEFLSLDLLKQQQILIRMYNIVERPDENWYRNLVDLINQNISLKKNISSNNNNNDSNSNNNNNRQQQKKHDGDGGDGDAASSSPSQSQSPSQKVQYQKSCFHCAVYNSKVLRKIRN
jgi:hypothetical protein